MKLQVKTETLFLLAKDAWSAKHILARVRKGELEKDKVLFKSDTLAYQRRSHLPLQQMKKIDVFKIQLTTTETTPKPETT